MVGAQSVTSSDGKVPVILGEYGDSTAGEVVDPNGDEVVDAVHASGYGFIAWTWKAGAADLLVSGGRLTPYGQKVAARIAR